MLGEIATRLEHAIKPPCALVRLITDIGDQGARESGSTNCDDTAMRIVCDDSVNVSLERVGSTTLETGFAG